jgi:hypothetical protein
MSPMPPKVGNLKRGDQKPAFRVRRYEIPEPAMGTYKYL